MAELQVTAPGVQVCRWAAPDDAYQASRIDGIGGTKSYVCARPDPGGDLEAQARQAYGRLDRILKDQGARRQDVVTEKLFLRDLGDVEALSRVRAAFYDRPRQDGPATTWLQQPPCREGQALELQARVVFATDVEHDVRVRAVAGDLGAGSARLVSSRGYEHLYAHNITGGTPGDGRDYAAQMADAFGRAEALLEAHGLTFRQVVRTWIYLPRMDRDYAALNRVRTAFFRRAGVERVPASTGIQGGVWPPDRLGSLDLYALRADRPVAARQMHAPTLNEAWAYGSRFCRGMEVTREDRTVLYVSGTASIDERGRVVAVGDIAGQVERMLTNVERLLADSRATPGDIVRATTYLKEPAFREAFEGIWRRRGFPTVIPHTVCVADVCRPEWLCETEVAAVFSPRPALA